MAENLVRLDLSRFTRADIDKILALRDKLGLMHRWFRWEQMQRDGCEQYAIYSGDRGPRRYAAYRIARNRDGGYQLIDHRGGDVLATGRVIDAVLDALPADFYYTGS